jgi:hypothetical protein
MVLGWPPSKIVSGDPDFQPRWLPWRAGLSDIIVKGILPARFGLIWFSSFRGKDLNVIFYQNKIEISSIDHCYFIVKQNELKF